MILRAEDVFYVLLFYIEGTRQILDDFNNTKPKTHHIAGNAWEYKTIEDRNAHKN